MFRPVDTTMYFRHTNTQGIADFEWINGESDWRPVGGHSWRSPHVWQPPADIAVNSPGGGLA